MATVFRSPLPDVDLPEIPISELVLRNADTTPDRAALIDGLTGETITFGELRTMAQRFAGGLTASGFSPGDTVALMAPNMPAYAVVFHGTAIAGGVVTTVNPVYGADEVRFQLNDAGADIIVTVPMFAETAKAAMEGTSAKSVYVIGEPEDDTVKPWTDLMGEPMEQVPVDVTSQLVVLPYSSGTTGLPKGVMLTHFNLVANIEQCEHVLTFEDAANEVALAVLPFFHIYGMQVLMNTLLSKGITIVTMPRFDMVQALDIIQTRKVTRFFAVPPIVLGLAKAPVVDNYDLSSLVQIVSGAAPLGAEVAAEASERIGCEVVQAYGMTELSPVSHCTRPGDFRPGSSGLTVSNTEIRLVDPETGEDQDRNSEGELWVRGPQVMVGYLNNQEATDATIDADGWLHTGDIAVIDEHDHVYIVDRVKELIKFKGFQVPPAELEALLLTNDKIADAAVIGIPDDEAGELPKAFVVLQPGQEMTGTEVQDFVKEHVASYKQIRLVEFRGEIPKSASGKILRRFLRDEG